MQNLENEEWRVIKDNPDYEVSNLGRVRNVKNDYILIGDNPYKDYHRVIIKRHHYMAYRLVAKAFPEICGEWFEGCQVHHIDKNPGNNHADNLVVCTKKEHYAYHHDDRVEMSKRPRTEEWKRKMREAAVKRFSNKENHPHYGKPKTEETKRKIGEANRKRYNSLSDEERETRNEIIRKSREHLKKPVLQYTLDGQFIREWDSCLAVEKELGIKNGNISSCCKGKQKTAYGYIWRYKEK